MPREFPVALADVVPLELTLVVSIPWLDLLSTGSHNAKHKGVGIGTLEEFQLRVLLPRPFVGLVYFLSPSEEHIPELLTGFFSDEVSLKILLRRETALSGEPHLCCKTTFLVQLYKRPA